MTEGVPRPGVSARSFDEQYGHARERLLAICIGLVGREDAEDVVQETYLRARRRFGQLRDPTAFDAWLTRIAINLCHTQRRRVGGLRDRLPLLVRGDRVDERELGLRELIEALPLRERTVLVLHHGYGYGLDEIARLLGLSHTNVRTIIFRTRRRLAQQWAEAER